MATTKNTRQNESADLNNMIQWIVNVGLSLLACIVVTVLAVIRLAVVVNLEADTRGTPEGFVEIGSFIGLLVVDAVCIYMLTRSLNS